MTKKKVPTKKKIRIPLPKQTAKVRESAKKYDRKKVKKEGTLDARGVINSLMSFGRF